MHYTFKWSFNLSINPIHIVYIRIWIGDNNYTWAARQPLTIERGNINGPKSI